MSWKPDAEIERLVATTIAGRIEAMALSLRDQQKALDAKLASRGTLMSGARIAGHRDIASNAFDEFAQGMIDDVLELFRKIYGEVPVEAAPWIKEKLSAILDGRAKGIQEAAQELARQMNVNVRPEPPASLGKARRRLDVELGTLEYRAKLKELTPPERKPLPAGNGKDAFICHASEDKADAARPIADALRGQGYTVWLDEAELKVGDRLLDKIDDGLANSRFGIVILSPNFFGKQWTRRELAGLVARQDAEERTIILPVWFNVDEKDIAKRLPSLAGILAARMSNGLDAVVEEIINAMGPPAVRDVKV